MVNYNEETKTLTFGEVINVSDFVLNELAPISRVMTPEHIVFDETAVLGNCVDFFECLENNVPNLDLSQIKTIDFSLATLPRNCHLGNFIWLKVLPSLESIRVPNNSAYTIGSFIDISDADLPNSIYCPVIQDDYGAETMVNSHFQSYRVYQKLRDEGYSHENASFGANLFWYYITGEECLESILDRNIPYLQVFAHQNIYETLKKYPQYLLAETEDELQFFIDHKDESYVFYLNCLNYEHNQNRSLTDRDIKSIKDLTSGFSEQKEKARLENLLNALKTKELHAAYVDFHNDSLKKSDVMFLDDAGYIRYTCKQKELDERFARFITGVIREDGTYQNFADYLQTVEMKNCVITGASHNRTAYMYASLKLQGIIPDKDFLYYVIQYIQNEQIGRPILPQNIKNIWKLYNANPCWSKTSDATEAYFKLATVFGLFENNRPTAQLGENYLRSITNYLPEQVSLDGYHAVKLYGATPQEITETSEITIKPGIPYKPKKAHKALLAILSEDEAIMDMFSGDKDKLDKYLKKIEPLSELMDYASVLAMPDGFAKNFMLRVVDDLYVNTAFVNVDLDKNELKDKEKLQKFHKLTEKNAGNTEEMNLHVLDSYKTHALFGGLKAVYNPDFAKFIKNHMRDILYADNPWKMGYSLSTIQSQWNTIQAKRAMDRRHFADKPTWKMSFNEIESILSTIVYDRSGVLEDEKYDEVADLCFSYRYNQSMFERTCRLYDEMCNRGASSIPNISGEYNGYTYKFLDLEDPAAIFFGQILDCCQQFGNAGESCMLHSCQSKNGRVFGVFDGNGMMVAGSWTWRNGDTICFDNIEVANTEERDDILNVYEEASNAILQAQRADDCITKITVGQGYSDVSLNDLPRDENNIYPIEEVSYINDSRTQYILSATNTHHEKDGIEFTPASYEREEIEHVNTTLGRSFESTAGQRNTNRFQLNDFEGPEDDWEDDFYEERHDDSVIDDDIDDYEIINRVVEASRNYEERER